MSKVRGLVKVEITIQIKTGYWDENLTLDQLRRQACNIALERARLMMLNNNDSKIEIAGSPKIVAVLGLEE
jgi:hypothetical protein